MFLVKIPGKVFFKLCLNPVYSINVIMFVFVVKEK